MSRRVVRWSLALMLALVIGLPLLALAQIPRDAVRYRGDLVRNARLVWGLSAPVATFAGQIHQESGWRADARSPFAHGLAQFTPDTADWISGLDSDLASADTGNPVWAIRALVRYDLWLFQRVPSSSACDRMGLALRGYNGGLGYIQKETRTGKPCTAFRSAASCKENLAYPQRILTRWEPIYEQAGWGLGSCP